MGGSRLKTKGNVLKKSANRCEWAANEWECMGEGGSGYEWLGVGGSEWEWIRVVLVDTLQLLYLIEVVPNIFAFKRRL